LTESYVVTNRRVFAIAGPAMLANLTTPLLGVVSTAAIGRLGDAAMLGGVAMASLVFDCLFWLFGFLRTGTLALTAQALGAGDRGEQRAALGRALITSTAIGVALIVLQLPLSAAIFGIMGGSEGATDAARHYFLIRLWSAPFALSNYVVLGWLVGLARPMLALSIQLAINLVSIVLTVALVLGAGWGIAGAAFAVLIAEASGLGIGTIVAWRVLGGRMDVSRAALFDRGKFIAMLVINRDIMIRTAALIAAYLFFMAQGARAGDVTLAGNSVLYNLVIVSAFFLDGIANAAQQICGRAFGAREQAAFRRAVKLVVAWGFGFGAAASAVFALFGPALVDLLTTSPAVRAMASATLWLAALTPICGALAFIFDGVYIGATWVRDMRNLMIVAITIYFAVWWAASPLGNIGLWSALLAFFLARGGLQAARYPALVRTIGTNESASPASSPR